MVDGKASANTKYLAKRTASRVFPFLKLGVGVSHSQLTSVSLCTQTPSAWGAPSLLLLATTPLGYRHRGPVRFRARLYFRRWRLFLTAQRRVNTAIALCTRRRRTVLLRGSFTAWAVARLSHVRLSLLRGVCVATWNRRHRSHVLRHVWMVWRAAVGHAKRNLWTALRSYFGGLQVHLARTEYKIVWRT